MMLSHASAYIRFARLGLWSCLGAATLSAPAWSSDTQVFSDGNFGAGLVSTKIVDTTPGSGATFTSVTQPGGVPGLYRDTSHTFDNGTIIVAHFDPQFTETPSATSICTIDFAADLIHFTGATIGGAVSYRLGLLQGGSYYGGPSIDVFGALWASYVQFGLTAADFTRFAGTGPAHPDFSCSGSAIQFGFLTGNSAGGGGPFTKDSGIDNWLVTLHLGRATWTDDTLAAADWTSTKIVDTTPGAAATTTSVSQPGGGNPGAYRETSHTYANGAIVVAHADANATHNPLTEPIYTIDFSADAIHETASTIGGAVALRVAVLQGSAYYGGPTINVFFGTWNNYTQSGLTANDFTLVAGAGPLHPDFTSSGTVLQFGYLTGNSASGGPVTKYIGIDNWSVTAHLTPPCSGPVGVPTCFGDDTFNPCPCFPSIPAGGSGRGCPNSVEPRGALLVALGTASVSNDTLVFQATGMPNSSCLYFQGDLQANIPWGDGRRCVVGNIVRIGTKTNICNSSQYPSASDLPISVKGLVVVPPGGYAYQVWYRNPASFCTSATYNMTNSLALVWSP